MDSSISSFSMPWWHARHTTQLRGAVVPAACYACMHGTMLGRPAPLQLLSGRECPSVLSVKTPCALPEHP